MSDSYNISSSITIYPDTGDAFHIIFDVPCDRDTEEYIDEMLEKIISKEFRYSDWEFD